MVAAGLCDEVLVQVAYAIGVAKPVGLYVNTYGTAKVKITDGEIAEAAWFTRAEIREALEHGDWNSDSESRLLLPGSISIAREIIESWAALD